MPLVPHAVESAPLVIYYYFFAISNNEMTQWSDFPVPTRALVSGSSSCKTVFGHADQGDSYGKNLYVDTLAPVATVFKDCPPP